MTTCLLMMAAGMGFSAADDEDVVYTRERAFRIPLEISDAERKGAAWIRLMVSTDGGKTWNRVREESPKKPTVTFRAPGDGQYWLALAVVGHDEKMHPSDPKDLKAGLKVVIDSAKPEVSMEAVKTRSGLRGVRWMVKDGSPEDKMALKCAVWDEKVKAWKPRSLGEVRNSTIWFGRNETIGKMQLMVADAAGNESVEQIDIDGDRFLCSGQEMFALTSKAPTPTQFAENAKSRVESRTLAEIEQASHRAAEETSMPILPKADPKETKGALADASPLPTPKSTKTTSAKPKNSEEPVVVKEEAAPKKTETETVAKAKPVAKTKTEKPAEETEESAPVVKSKPAAKSTTEKPAEETEESTSVVKSKDSAAKSKPVAEAKPAKKPVESDADVTYSNRRTTVLHYEMTGIPKGEAVELWGQKGGKEWIRLGRDEDGASPMEAVFPDDGRWGVTLVVGDASGSGKPSKSDPPSTWVEVDTKRPQVEIQGVVFEKTRVRLTWNATDSNLVEDSVRISYSRDKNGPWETIAVQQAGDGEYLWKASDEATAKPIYIRIDATDRAGNIGTATSAKVSRKGAEDESETAGVDASAAKPTKKASESSPAKEE